MRSANRRSRPVMARVSRPAFARGALGARRIQEQQGRAVDQHRGRCSDPRRAALGLSSRPDRQPGARRWGAARLYGFHPRGTSGFDRISEYVSADRNGLHEYERHIQVERALHRSGMNIKYSVADRQSADRRYDVPVLCSARAVSWDQVVLKSPCRMRPAPPIVDLGLITADKTTT